MISNSKKRAPKPSLDDLIDDLINMPSDVDTQLVGGVVADKAKSSRIMKGQAELVELNAWIDANNKRPDIESSDFKESQLARRMNGYAFQPKEHEDLKPFDKYGLIDADLYHKPLVKFDDYEDLTPLDLLNVEDLLIDSDDKAMAETEIFSAELTDEAILAEPEPEHESIPLTIPAISDAAKAILKLRAAKANELNDMEGMDDEDEDEDLLIDTTVGVITDTVAIDSDLESTPQAEDNLRSPIDDYYFDLQKQDFVSKPVETEAVQADVAIPTDFNDAADTVVVGYIPTNIADIPSFEEPLIADVMYAPNLSYLDILYNPPAPALSPSDITYVSKYTTFAFDDVVDIAQPTDEADEILQAFSQVPFQEYVPDSYEESDTSWFDAQTQAALEVDSFGIGGYLSEDAGISEPEPEPASSTSAEIPSDDKQSLDGEDADSIATAELVPTNAYASDIYWSIDGDYDTAIVNSDSATGLTQRHNPEPPMTAAEKDSRAKAQAQATAHSYKSTEGTKPQGDTDFRSSTNFSLDLGSNSNSPVESPTTPQTAGKDASNTQTRTKSAVDSAMTTKSVSDRTRPIPSSTTKQHDLTKPKNPVVGAVEEDLILTSIDYFLDDAVSAGKKATQSNATTEIETFDSLDDILDGDLDFLESLSAAEDKYFDMANEFGANSGDRATPDEIGKQTPCTDFYMHEAYFKILHRRLESGDLKTIKYTATNIKVGDAFILEGMVGFIQSFGEDRTGSKGTPDPRLRIIFDNKTESNILLSSLNTRMYKDQANKRIIPSADDFTDFDNPDTQKRTRTGQVYILRSLSDNPIVKGVPNLYKIGFTRNTVEDRIKNATRDTTFLESPVEVVLKADCFNTNPAGLESLIHGFLAVQRVNIKLTGKNGGQYEPQEWFSIELEEAKKVIIAIMNNEILDYRIDNTTGRMVAR